MTASMKANTRKTRGLGLSLLLGVGLLVLSLLLALPTVKTLQDRRVARWIEMQEIFGPKLIWPFIGYAAALLLIHLMFGVAVWLLAILSEKGMNSRGWSRRAHVLTWFVLLTFWVLLANAVFFPWSHSTASFRLLVQPFVGNVTTFDLVTGALLLITFICGWRIIDHLPGARRIVPRVALYSLAIVSAVSAWQWMRIDAAMNEPVTDASRPNIIIVGIDSLRPDFIGAGRHELGYTPELDLFLRESTLFTDAITPLGRTFAAWMSILTGQAPITTGVRDNLVPRDLSTIGPTLADRLKAAGYRTVYATDEVRFSNIDRSYGFDQVIGPRMGITDFVLGRFNDLPLANLLANSWAGSALFPDTYANRAAATTYRPRTFVHRIEADLDVSEPIFLATHLTLPHHPFHWTDDSNSLFSRTTDLKYEYTAAVVAADRQFADLMAAFERRGLLRNAIVVVLSDHGEGLGLPRDNAVYSKDDKRAVGRIRVAMNGHGNSVLSPSQYSVVLAFRGFGPAGRLTGYGRLVDIPVSLEDVTPTLLDLSGMTVDAQQFDGQSLADVFKQWPDIPAERYERIRFTETGFPVDFGGGGEDNGDELVKQAIDMFRVDAETGRVEMRKDAILSLLRVKQRAAIKGDWLLAAIPDDMQGTAFVMINRRGLAPARLLDVQQVATTPDTADLWRSLQARYKDEFVLAPRLSGDVRLK